MSMTKYLAILRGVNVHSIKEILLLKDLKKIPNIEKSIWLRKSWVPFEMLNAHVRFCCCYCHMTWKNSNGLSRTKIHSLFCAVHEGDSLGWTQRKKFKLWL